MQTISPPIRFTGNPVVDWTILILVAGGALYVLKAVRLSRDTLRPMLGLFIGGFLLGLAYYQWRGQTGGDTPMKDGVFSYPLYQRMLSTFRFTIH